MPDPGDKELQQPHIYRTGTEESPEANQIYLP